MPIKNYGQLDVINYVSTPVLGGTIIPTISAPNFGTVTISGSEITSADPNSLNFAYTQTGELTYSDIPENATITSVIITIQWLYNASISVTNPTGELITLGHSADMSFPFILPGPADPDAVIVNFSGNNNGFNLVTFFQSDNGVHNFVIDYPNGIDKATLITNHGNLGNEMGTQLISGIDPPGVGSSTITGLFEYSNFNLEVTYVEGPIQYDLVDNGDSVEVSNESTIKSLTGEDAEDITDVLIEIGTDENGDKVYTPATIKFKGKGKIIFIVPNPKYPPEGIPPGVTPPVGPVVVAVRGKTFDGIVIIGSFTILYSQSSGIYELIKNKTNDTLYIHDTGETSDYAIPEPFIKTGFIEN